MAMAICNELLMPDVAIASGPSGPTMIVSTTPIAIQPSSARMTGIARRSMGFSSARSDMDGAALRAV
jgi:hypothetical protein